jgi:hypothetical protein
MLLHRVKVLPCNGRNCALWSEKEVIEYANNCRVLIRPRADDSCTLSRGEQWPAQHIMSYVRSRRVDVLHIPLQINDSFFAGTAQSIFVYGVGHRYSLDVAANNWESSFQLENRMLASSFELHVYTPVLKAPEHMSLRS